MTSLSARLEEILGHRFRDPHVLAEAFLHDSFLHENPEPPLHSNERLEFLGDAWLDYAVADELYRRFPEAPEGVLTKFRAVVVQRSTLAGVAARLGLAEFMQMGHGEDRTGGRQRASNLAGLYEAVVGALLVDGGEAPAKAFVLRTLGETLTDLEAGAFPQDHKSALQEYCQARRWGAPDYRVTSTQGPPHAREFMVDVVLEGEVAGRGHGPSRQQAEKEAARAALATLQGSRDGAGPP